MALRLLIIEHTEDDAVLLARELREGGFDVEFKRVESLQELTRVLDESSWDAVIADPKLPTLPGLDVLPVIQAKGLDLPIILLSGEIEADEIVKMMKAGANDVIKKGDFQRLALALKRELKAAEARRERRQAIEALWESEKRFRSYFELGLVGMAITAPDTGFVEVNHKFCKIFNYEQDELRQMKWAELIHPADVAVNTAHYNRVQAGETDGYALETKYIRKDGRIIDVALSTKCQRQADGSMEYCLMHLQDITESKEKEDKIVSYQRRLRSLAAEIGFVEERERRKIAVALHDQIGQPLALASIKLGKLRQEVNNEHLGEQIDSIRGMLAYAIGSSRNLTFELSPPILYELGLEAAVSSLAERYRQEHGIQIDCRTDDRQPKPMSDDICVLLFQGIRELLTNVLKHAQAQKITISIQREGANIRVMVEDDGVGFNPKDEETLTGNDHGFGLFSLRERMNYLGGNFVIESYPRGGTRATLTAPLQIASEEHGGAT